MRESLLISARAMDLNRDTIDITSNNIANLDTVGYKRDKAYNTSFKDIIASRLYNPTEKYSVPHNVSVTTDFSSGGFKFTADDLNVAISGDGFFKVTMPDDTVAYTRRGVLSLDSQKRLLIGGNPVVGSSGPITLEDTNIIIDETGRIFNSKNQLMGQMSVVDIEDKSQLRKVGNTLFQASEEVEEKPSEAVIKQKYLEDSNVNQSNAMIEMISLLDSLRQFETQQKLVQMQDEMTGKVIAQVGAV
ncbi:MAG: flagellar hook basal-body protein [Candidatus Margulisbacteria bacterium]|nr:flagellar hook basal-body protein [Candidatus Margulisiibacteriota bacterium]